MSKTAQSLPGFIERLTVEKSLVIVSLLVSELSQPI